MTLNRDASNQTYVIDPQDVKSISFLYSLAKIKMVTDMLSYKKYKSWFLFECLVF